MAKSESVFKVKFMTKPYLLKYLQYMYGHPIRITTRTPLRNEIAILLEKNIFPRHSKEQLQYKLTSYKTECTILLPYSWLKNREFGTGLSEKNAVSLNEFIHWQFEMYFFQFITSRIYIDKRFNSINNIIEQFADHLNIIIDEDITMDALTKIAFRLREKLCTPKTQPITQKLVVQYHIYRQPSLFN